MYCCNVQFWNGFNLRALVFLALIEPCRVGGGGEAEEGKEDGDETGVHGDFFQKTERGCLEMPAFYTLPLLVW